MSRNARPRDWAGRRYGFMAMEEHFWAIALDSLETPAAAAAAEAACVGGGDDLWLADTTWRRGAVFQTWPYCESIKRGPRNSVLRAASKCCEGPFCAPASRRGRNVEEVLRDLRRRGVLFARKFNSTASAGLLDAIDGWAADDAAAPRRALRATPSATTAPPRRSLRASAHVRPRRRFDGADPVFEAPPPPPPPANCVLHVAEARGRAESPVLEKSYFSRRRLHGISTSWPRRRRDPPPRKPSTE